ncbi:hypothetical protein ACLI09_10820 [Flavobacterium sp. RHBU_24]|uniref:hypothetical protein n=1 Tax=Flavobacterium sp. RHBU_24 TaxID=3391185 RepID=UPI003984DA8D
MKKILYSVAAILAFGMAYAQTAPARTPSGTTQATTPSGSTITTTSPGTITTPATVTTPSTVDNRVTPATTSPVVNPNGGTQRPSNAMQNPATTPPPTTPPTVSPVPVSPNSSQVAPLNQPVTAPMQSGINPGVPTRP